jgi:hypothetical protein
MVKQAKRWTKEEESRALSNYSSEWISQQGMATVIAGQREVDRKSNAKAARKAAHISRNGAASANRWY